MFLYLSPYHCVAYLIILASLSCFLQLILQPAPHVWSYTQSNLHSLSLSLTSGNNNSCISVWSLLDDPTKQTMYSDVYNVTFYYYAFCYLLTIYSLPYYNGILHVYSYYFTISCFTMPRTWVEPGVRSATDWAMRPVTLLSFKDIPVYKLNYVSNYVILIIKRLSGT